MRSKIKDDEHEYAYKVYMTDTSRLITENTAKFNGGSYTKIRWMDIVDDRPKEKPKSESEVIAHISAGLDRLGRA